jgi:hypothetical protein
VVLDHQTPWLIFKHHDRTRCDTVGMESVAAASSANH